MAGTKGSKKGKSRPSEVSINSPKWLHRRQPPMKLRTPNSRKPSTKLRETTTTVSEIEQRVPQEGRRTERATAILDGMRKLKNIKDVKTPEREKIKKDKVTTPTRFSPRKHKTTQQKPNTTQQRLANSKRPTQAETNPPRPPSPQRPPSPPTNTSSATVSDLRFQPAATPAKKRKTPSKSSEQQMLPYKTKKKKVTGPAIVRDEALITDLTVPAVVVHPPAENQRRSPRGLEKSATHPPAPAIDQFVTDPHSSDGSSEEDTGPELSSYPSIRCRSAGFIAEGGVSGRKKRVRGVFNGSKVVAYRQAKCKGQRIKVEMLPNGSAPVDGEIDSLLTHDIGSCVRDSIPMMTASWTKVPAERKRILFEHLAQNFKLEKEDDPLWDYVCGKAAERFRDWKSRCKKMFKTHGPDVTPREFVDREGEWEWLKNHFSEAKNKKRGETMSAVRNAPNRLTHRAGKRPFRARAAALAAGGDRAPLVSSFKQMYVGDPKGTEYAEKMDAMVQQALAEQFPEESEHSLVDQHPEPLPEATQVEIISKVVDQKRGTYIRGTGKAIRRAALPRGGPRNADLREQLKAKDDTIREMKALFDERIRVLEELAVRGGSTNVPNQDMSEGETSLPQPRVP